MNQARRARELLNEIEKNKIRESTAQLVLGLIAIFLLGLGFLFQRDARFMAATLSWDGLIVSLLYSTSRWISYRTEQRLRVEEYDDLQ
jgi:hypothetical protein